MNRYLGQGWLISNSWEKSKREEKEKEEEFSYK
jgi:hypothetical protein